jgi:hypothetical protein
VAAKIYEYAEQGSAFRQVVVSSIAWDVVGKKRATGVDVLTSTCPLIAADALKVIAESIANEHDENFRLASPFTKDRWDECHYHDHAAGEGCEAVRLRRAM